MQLLSSQWLGVSSNATTARATSEAEQSDADSTLDISKVRLLALADAGVRSQVSDMHDEEELQQ